MTEKVVAYSTPATPAMAELTPIARILYRATFTPILAAAVSSSLPASQARPIFEPISRWLTKAASPIAASTR